MIIITFFSGVMLGIFLKLSVMDEQRKMSLENAILTIILARFILAVGYARLYLALLVFLIFYEKSSDAETAGLSFPDITVYIISNDSRHVLTTKHNYNHIARLQKIKK